MENLISKLTGGSHRLGWALALRVALLATLLLPSLLALPGPYAPPRAQNALLHIAENHPADPVQVIVQKEGTDAGPEELVARLGGTVTKDLWIINAFAAQLPAGAVPVLATAAGVRWVSLDAPVLDTACKQCMDTSRLVSYYVQAIGADKLWNEEPYLRGQGITVAVVDSGITFHTDLTQEAGFVRILASSVGPGDGYGHGTHVAGIIGGNGALSDGGYIGVAPGVNVVNVRVSDAQGKATTSEVVGGLQWVYENKDQYNIRVVNLSLNSSVAESYHLSPLDAALEILWFNGVVVVVAAGNEGVLYPPANDPFVITVGAADDMGTAYLGDDVLADFSPYGTTPDGFAKPDLVAPGVDIISLLAKKNCVLYKQHRDHTVLDSADRPSYFRMSGTSMASAVTSGAVALLLQDEPDLTPDQVKYRLMATARSFDKRSRAGAGHLDIYAAVHGTTTDSANTGLPASQLLWTGDDPVVWDSVNWTSVNWNSVNWNSVNWTSVNWNSVNWTSVNWNG